MVADAPATSLLEVGAYLPDTSYALEDIADVVGLSEKDIYRYRRFFGLDRVRWDPQARHEDLLVSAARTLTGLPGNEHRVRYVLYGKSFELLGPYTPNPLQEASRELGLGHAVTFSVSQHNCGSGLLAVDLAGRLLDQDRRSGDGPDDAIALVLAGEKTYPHVADYLPSSTAMGEGASACLVGLDGETDRLLAYDARTYGEFHVLYPRSAGQDATFDRRFGQLFADLITDTAAQAGLTVDELSLIVPHNINRIAWTTVCKALSFPVDKVALDLIPVTGHCFCADVFLNYANARGQGRLRPGDHYLMATVGMGSTFSAMVFQH